MDALLFDMDGTLSETEAFWHRADERIVAEYGTKSPDARSIQQVGASMDSGARFLQEHHGVAMSIQAIQQLVITYVLEQISEGFEWRPGARELLEEARSMRIPRALVTTSPQVLAQAVVSSLPAGTFDLIISDEDVTHTKPHPEPYLLAAQRLGANPRRCVAFEDSVTGSLSALQAGCFVVAVPTHAVIEESDRLKVLPSLADLSITDLRELLNSRRETQGTTETA